MNPMHASYTQHTPRISHHLLSISLCFPLLSTSKPRPYRHRLKRIRHGGGAVKKPIHVSATPTAKSSKSRRCFRRTRMKRSWRGGWLRPVAVQVVEAHYPTRHGGGTAERRNVCSLDQLRGLRRRLSSPSPPSSPPEVKKEHADALGRGLASASALWQLFRQGGVAAAAARRWLLVLQLGTVREELWRR